MLEHFFVIFLISGTFKDYFLYYQLELPIDFTLLSAIVTVLCLSFRIIITNKIKANFSVRNKLVIMSFLLFWLWMIISLSYSPSPKYSFIKTFLFSTNFLTIIIVAFGKLNVKKVMRYFIFYTYLFLLGYIPVLIGAQLGSIPYSTLNKLGGMYLTLGLNLGIIVLVLKFSTHTIFNENTDKYLRYVSFILLILIGARGPLVFTIFVYIIYYLSSIHKIVRVNFKFSFKKLFLNGITIASLGFIFIYYFDKIRALFERSLSRIALMFSSEKGSSIETRVEHVKKSLDLLKDPLVLLKGIGIGSYMYVTQNIDTRGYPHNILLEVWVELGIIGLILFLLIFFSFISIGKKSRYISKLLLVYLFLNLLVSSSLVDIRLTIGFFMLFIEDQFSLTGQIIDKKNGSD